MDQAIRHWKPKAVIAVGIAFGIDKKKQDIGDVLVATQLQPYELARLNPNGTITQRADRPSGADRLVNQFRMTDDAFSRTADEWPKNRFGLVLSGEKLVDNFEFMKRLRECFPEAIGGEMEASGLYTSAHAHKVDWLVVKAICDWGYGKNSVQKKDWQTMAANNAAGVVKAALDVGCLYQIPVDSPRVDTPPPALGPMEPLGGLKKRVGKSMDRNEMLTLLKQLPDERLSELVFTLQLEASIAENTPRVMRAMKLIQHVESKEASEWKRLGCLVASLSNPALGPPRKNSTSH